MSVSNVTLSPSVGQAAGHSSIRHQARQDFDELFRAMQAGNLSDAQQAYSALQQLQSGAPAASGSTISTGATAASAGSGLAADWSSLGQALQSGSLPSAQDAFSKLEQDLASASQARPHHRDLAQAEAVYAAMQSVSTTTGASSAGGNVGSDLAALKQALQSGDTTSAQDLLAKLEQDLQASGQGIGHHHHRHGGFNAQNVSAAYSATTVPGTSSSTSTTSSTNGNATNAGA